MDERGELPGHHGEEPGSQAEAKRKGSELIALSFEGHSEKSSGLWVDGDVKVSILEVNAVCPHPWEERGSDGFCRFHLEAFEFQEMVEGL